MSSKNIGYNRSNYYDSDKVNKSKFLLLITLGAVVATLIGVYSWLWGLNSIHWFTTDFREHASFWGPFTIMIITVIGLGIWGWNKELDEISTSAGVSMVVVGTVGLIVAIVLALCSPFWRLNAYYDASVEYKTDTVTSDFAERTPYEVAEATASRSMMNTTGEGWLTKSLAEVGDNGEWNTLIKTRGIGEGYESVQNATYPLFGTTTVNDVEFCKFDPNAKLRHSGAFPQNNLSRAIFGMVPLNVSFAAEDSYAYCNEKNEPIVVTPLKKIDGFFFPVWSYYGIAVYNGSDGDLDIITNADKINEHPGPVYPMSLAQTQRESLTTGGGFWDWVHKKYGYETATDNSEVQLRKSGSDETSYVTTLSRPGSSTSVVSVSEINANSYVGENGYNPLIVNELPETHYRPANTTLVDEIRSQYSSMPDIVSESTQVFEITAGENGQWVASLGREQSVIYRAYITPGETSITLKNSRGETVANTSTVTDPETGETTVTVGNNLTEMTDAELVELGKSVMDELASRNSE